MFVKVLEETLGIQSVLPNQLLELIHNSKDIIFLLLSSLSPIIHSVCASHTNFLVQILFKSFLGEYFIHSVAEVSPSYAIRVFGRSKGFTQLLEFRVRYWQFSHA